MKIIGLTGGIASGKSTVTKILQKRFSFVVIDADELARQAVKPGSDGLKKIVAHFGDTIIDQQGNLNRGYLGELIANDETARKKLNSIIHPEITKLMEQQVNFYKQVGMPAIFYDCPLLFEEKIDEAVDETLLIVADEEIRINRIMERDGLDRDQAIKRIKMQMSNDEKIKLADTIIENNGSEEDLLISVNAYLSMRKPWVKENEK